MKSKIFALAILMALPIFSMAQSPSLDDEITLIQSAFGMEKQALVRQYMDLPESRSQAFWNIYQQYEQERRSVARERLKIINEYLENYENLDEAKLDDLAKRRLKVDASRAKLHSKYYKMFKKATNATDAAKFLQLDDYIHSTISLVLLESLPFIGEIK
jgi:Spy/CpxP family protein refolding chaperone